MKAAAENLNRPGNRKLRNSQIATHYKGTICWNFHRINSTLILRMMSYINLQNI